MRVRFSDLIGQAACESSQFRGKDLTRNVPQAPGTGPALRAPALRSESAKRQDEGNHRVAGLQRYAKTQYGIALTLEEATRHRETFFRTYPGLALWHAQVRRRRSQETRTLADRRRLLGTETPDTERLNTPVQGTG